jgi:lipid A 3-O-deacylase
LKRLAAAAILGAGCAAAAAEQPRWYLQVDNDVVFGTDRWYTSGVRIARVDTRGDHEIEWGILQEIYTPEAKHFAPGTVDRAPAARLLLSLARHDAMPACLQTLEVAVGVRGPSAQGRRATEFVHRLVPAPEVDWSREDSDRLDAQVAAVRSQRSGDAVVHYGAVAGTERTFAHAGAEMQFGKRIATGLLRFAPTPPPAAGPAGWGAFAGLGARAVARDRLLERGYDPDAPAPDRERVVGRLAAGVGTVQRWGSAILSLALDSREFAGQRVPQAFGSLVVHVDF